MRYDAVNAMLLNEFLKEHRTVKEQKRGLQLTEATIAQQQKQIEALTAGLQKVSAQLEMSPPSAAGRRQSSVNPRIPQQKQFKQFHLNKQPTSKSHEK